MIPDPYAPHLRQADTLFARGELVRAGQIWQAILKQDPNHAEARANLLVLKQRLLALREAEAAAATTTQAPAPPSAPPEPALPEPAPSAPPLVDARATAPEAPPHELDSRATAPEAPMHRVDPRSTAPEGPAPVDPGKVVTGALDPERLLRQGCTLYDMGQLQDALNKWEQVLTLDPDNHLARGYANGARRELGLPSLEVQAAPMSAPLEIHHAEVDVEKLLREAVQLYDMGLTNEAISKWERVLVLEPQRHEIEGYLRQARREALPEPAQPAHFQQPRPASADSEALDLKLRQGEHLLNLQRRDEAAFTFQQALALDPGNARALQGLERCRKGGQAAPVVSPVRSAPVLSLDAQGRIAMAESEPPAAPTEPQGVEPPAALQKAAPAPREGLSLPERLRQSTDQMPWLREPKLLVGVGGGVLVLALATGFIHSYRKDQALKEDVLAARIAAVAPLAQQAQAPDLAESPAELREEAEAALGIDPLRAYLRAQTLLVRNPGEAAAPQLLEKARAGLPGGVSGASLSEFQKHLQNGDLEAALKVIDALLRAQPDDPELRARAARLHLTLCFAHASQAKWDEAREDLLRGRALFPGDKTWQARIKLLEKVKVMPKDQRAAWIALLG
ncbi:MAG: tetratricopeptide repeat protein [Holophagaceae bacterium]|uniref:Tetratricopeptide repeat protein n=1 Tax=Candidatus Geothrix skivensis TaxID=2954439 RepID=A0A9D7SIY8_9BACT|nr:tetratricopeptide repeat protein [Candidatus Geothrix skivensis]